MKEGFTMSEIEQFGKQHKLTILFCGIYLLSAIFTKIWSWGDYSIWLFSLGIIVAICFPRQIGTFLVKLARMICFQDKTVRMIFAGVAVALSIIFPPLLFCIGGLIAGVAIKARYDLFHGKDKSENTEKPEGPHERGKSDFKDEGR